LYKPFFLDSIKAYNISLLLVAKAKPILPKSPFGRPSLSVFLIQFLPPSIVTNSPRLDPPDLKNHG
jgi:hypothetical protein